MKNFVVFYRFLAKYKWRVLILSIVTSIAVIMESLSPYWMKRIIESATNNQIDEVWRLIGLLGFTLIGGQWLSALAFTVGDWSIIPLMQDVKQAVFKKIMDLDFAFHVNRNTGSLISAFRRGEGAVFNLYYNIHQELFRVLIHLGVAIYFLISVSWETAVALLVLFLVNLLLIRWLIKINIKSREEFNKCDDEVAGIIADNMINYETVKFFAAEKKESARLEKKLIEWGSKMWKNSNSFRVMDMTIGSTGGIGIMIVLSLALNKLKDGIGVGNFVMVAGFITGFYYQFFNLFFRIRDIVKSMTDLQKYFEILENEIEVKDPKKGIVPKSLKGKVEFKEVGFIYPKTKDKILDKISLKINSGQRVAFVGRSGAGKTTLIKLLLRFYDTSEGRIKIDGIDIKKIKKTDLRSFLGVVPQEPIMFNNTIKFNLAYGKENATIDELKEVARRANILEFIEKLPNSWETEVGERGIKLSGGQKQRLAIARALLADPKILIFDEATSNLDSESEKMIQTALNEAAKKRTLIIIAHRFSTIKDADKIIVLSNGTIAETGKHNELIDKNGIYKMLWTLQAKGKLTENENLVNA